MKVLTSVQYYVPGAKAGGPIRSVSNLVRALGSEMHFRIVTSDRDVGDSAPYASVQRDRWTRVGNADVYYASPGGYRIPALRQLIQAEAPDVIYARSLFAASTRALLAVRALGLNRDRRLVISPDGELSPGAMRLKTLKKQTFLAAARASGVLNGVTWHASSDREAEDLRRQLGAAAHVVTLPQVVHFPAPCPPSAKQAGTLRLAFVGRAARNKNLLGALEILGRLGAGEGRVSLDVYGNLEDARYVRRCREAIRALPSTVSVALHGAIDHASLWAVLADHDFLFLPTWGESFGHAIIEAMAAGCPVIVSDRTPWRGLEALGVGWDVALENAAGFVAVLERARGMSGEMHAAMRERAVAFAQANVVSEQQLARYRLLFGASRFTDDGCAEWEAEREIQ